MATRNEELGQTISQEEGKIIAEGRGEASRAVETMMGSAEEAKRIHGETVPLDADPTGGKKLGFTLRVPCGVVAAIAPFNFPLNLVCHKVGPALAAGNTVIVKPASDTPLSAIKLTEILLESGLPPEGIQCLTGSGGEIGDALVADRRVRKVTFTGSREVGDRICRTAGIKKVTMELGSNSPVIVMPDADLEKVSAVIAMTGYGNAGQTCISTQRVLTAKKIYGDFLGALKPRVEGLATGNQLDEKSKVGPMVKESEAARVDDWVNEAVGGGARLVAGGGRRGAIYMPAVVADVHPDMRISRDELFGPAVAVTPFEYHRRGDRVGKRQRLRFGRRHLYGKRRMGDEVRPRSGSRQSARQLGLAVARRSDALRRFERLGLRQRGTEVCRRGDDGIENGGVSSE